LVLQLVELKEAEQQSLKESERLEKEIAEVQELKVNGNGYFIF
jgi:F-type H+-transporting ATPase subunit d